MFEVAQLFLRLGSFDLGLIQRALPGRLLAHSLEHSHFLLLHFRGADCFALMERLEAVEFFPGQPHLASHHPGLAAE